MPRLAAPWSGSPARNRPPPACPKLQDWSPATYQGKLALPGPFQPQLQPCLLRRSQLGAAPGASGGSCLPGLLQPVRTQSHDPAWSLSLQDGFCPHVPSVQVEARNEAERRQQGESTAPLGTPAPRTR